MTILEMYHRGICLPRKSIAVKAEIQTIFLREIDQIAKSDTFFGGLLKVAEYFLRMDNDLNCIKYCVRVLITFGKLVLLNTHPPIFEF